MAIVLDQFDPSGMFSKAGRVSLEMFQIIQHKNEILFNKKKYYKPNASSFGLYDLDSLKKGSNSVEEFKEKNRTINDKQLKKNVINKSKTMKEEPFTKTVSRDQLSQIITKEKLNDKRFGMYHPRYNLVFKKSPLYIYENKEEMNHKKKNENNEKSSPKGKNNQSFHTKSSHNSLRLNSIKLNTLPDLPIKFEKKINLPIPLSKQLPRKEIFISALNEKRFEYIELPQIYTKVRRPKNISLKYGGRSDHDSVFASERSGLEYKPKYNLVFPKDDLMIPNFKKTVSRKPNPQITYTLNETSLTYDEFNTDDFSPTRRKITGPIFEKMLSRDMSVDESKNGSISFKEPSKNKSEKILQMKKIKENGNSNFPNIFNSNKKL